MNVYSSFTILPFFSVSLFWKKILSVSLRKRERAGGRDTGRGRGGLHAEQGALFWDHDLSQRLTLNQLSPSGAPQYHL